MKVLKQKKPWLFSWKFVSSLILFASFLKTFRNWTILTWKFCKFTPPPSSGQDANETKGEVRKYLLDIKETVSWDRFLKYRQKFRELGQTKGRGWFMNFFILF
jgi:hypothetical protein